MLLDVKARVRELRKRHRLTMAEFANSIGVSPGNVGDWESLKRNSVPSAQALIAISLTYKVSTDWLLRGIDNDSAVYSMQPQARFSANPQLFNELIEHVILMSEDDLHEIVYHAREIIAQKVTHEKHA